MSLAVRRGACAADDAPLAVHRDGGRLPSGTDSLNVERDAYAEERSALARLSLLCTYLFHSPELERRVQGALVVTGVVDEAQRRRMRKVVSRDEIAPSQLDGIDFQLVCRDVNEPLENERGFGSTRATVRASRNLRRGEAENLDLGRRDRVTARKELGRSQCGHRCRRVQVGAEVREIPSAHS